MNTQDSPTLTIDANHVYRLGERRVPGTTSVISTVIPRQYNPGDWYLSRGHALHVALHLLSKGTLDRTTVDESYKPKLEAFERFQAQTGYKITQSEMRLYSTRYIYAGTIDAIMVKETDCPILVDFKSSFDPTVFLQLAAYDNLVRENGISWPCKALALELRDDSTYICHWVAPVILKRAWQQFLAALTVYNCMEQYGLTKKREGL
jgi:hypothetical protein